MNKCAISELLSSVVCSNSNYSCIVCGRNICLAFALVIRIYFLFFFVVRLFLKNLLIYFLLSMLHCRMSVIRTLALLTIGATIALAQRRLALPDPRSCANRKYRIHIHTLHVVIVFLIPAIVQLLQAICFNCLGHLLFVRTARCTGHVVRTLSIIQSKCIEY